MLVPEDHTVSELEQGLEAIDRELAGKEVRVGRIGPPQFLDQISRDLRRPIRVRVPTDAVGPVYPGQSVPSAAFWILNLEERWEVVLLGVARMLHRLQARHLKLLPEPAVAYHQHGVPPREDEELRPHAELVKRNLRHHDVIAAGNIPVPQSRLA